MVVAAVMVIVLVMIIANNKTLQHTTHPHGTAFERISRKGQGRRKGEKRKRREGREGIGRSAIDTSCATYLT